MAEWDAQYINDLPDSAFAVILPGGDKDEDGKTVPRDLRKLPHHNSAGDVDLPHLRNALSREPQSDMPDTVHERAHAHLMNHAEAEGVGDGETRTVDVESEVEVRDAAKREIDVRLVPWDHPIDTLGGPEMFVRGAFTDVAPDGVLLMGLDHEAHLGIGQDGNLVPRRRPVGRSIALADKQDGQHATFRVAKTAAGDEVLALAADGIYRGVSMEFKTVPGGTATEMRGGRRMRIHHRAALPGAALTTTPAYGEQAAVLAVRSHEDKEAPEVAEAPQEAPAPEPFDATPILEEVRKGLGGIESRSSEAFEKMIDRLGKVEEQVRSSFTIPAKGAEEAPVAIGQWASIAVRMLSGERVSNEQMRTVADIITTDNIGVVPPTYSNELIGVIDPSRPFMNSTRRLATPQTGYGNGSLILPRLKTRPTVAQQVYEKDELASTPVEVETATFNAVTKGGVGDISIQLLKLSDPSFLDLYVRLLAEAYAVESEHEAVEALLDTVGSYQGAVDGGSIDPNNLSLGTAWTASMQSGIKRTPDSIWLSSAGVAAFIDAKATGTNAPLYSQLSANFTAGGGVGGTISGLRAVHVPALDDQLVDVIVGPSNGYAWAEAGTFNLQVDVPSKAGRDVALVGILWFAPLYPAAFTTYALY